MACLSLDGIPIGEEGGLALAKALKDNVALKSLKSLLLSLSFFLSFFLSLPLSLFLPLPLFLSLSLPHPLSSLQVPEAEHCLGEDIPCDR